MSMADNSKQALLAVENGDQLSALQAQALSHCDDIEALMQVASAQCLEGHGVAVSYSKKVFIPLTRLCRDVCHYCTFATAPRDAGPAYLSRDAILDIARRGAELDCKEALFTLGDKPELRYAAARQALETRGHDSTLALLEEAAEAVLKETGLLPHLNPGIMDEDWLTRLRAVSASQGIMLETTSDRLSERGGPHFGSPDKVPSVRLATLEAAGRAAVPFTTGLLIGIGETRAERIDTLLAIRDLHERYGHIQEVIIQNFRAKPDTKMANAPEPPMSEHLWTIAVARLVLGPAMSIQAPPNLQPGGLSQLIAAGINDWGGVSPLTPDHVNPEAPWPHLHDLEVATEAADRQLVERLTVYPKFARAPERWLAPGLHTRVLQLRDGAGLAREENWSPGTQQALPTGSVMRIGSLPSDVSAPVAAVLDRLAAGDAPSEQDVVTLFDARSQDFAAVCAAADRLRQKRVGDTVSYVVNRNINYTNICTYACTFCAFSKGRHSAGLREKGYDLSLEEIAARTSEAAAKGATEVCLQGGIKPSYSGDTYLAITEAVKAAVPDMHVHAFSPLEVWHGATTLGLPLRDYLARLKDAGLSSLPGTAAEILDDEVRAILCPDKLNTAEWFEVMQAAHDVGLKSTATIMFGHVDGYQHWARHLLRVRAQQELTGGFTEFVPLAFVHMEAPIYLKGRARKGPTFREAILMHAVARLVLDPGIVNIQASWVKMGPDGAALCLATGANDLGGVLMNESITRAAGAEHGQELTADAIEEIIAAAGRTPRRRSTFYADVEAGIVLAEPDLAVPVGHADGAGNRMSEVAAE